MLRKAYHEVGWVWVGGVGGRRRTFKLPLWCSLTRALIIDL